LWISDFPIFEGKEVEQFVLLDGIAQRAPEHVLAVCVQAGVQARRNIPRASRVIMSLLMTGPIWHEMSHIGAIFAF